MHHSWHTLRSRIMEYLERNTIADLAKALDQKEKTLAGSRRFKAKRTAVAAKKG
jgi:DNA-binding IscR family transcriptional regulator